MKIDYTVYPENGAILHEDNLKVGVNFKNYKDINISSLRMSINNKHINSLLSKEGIYYNNSTTKIYGLNRIKIEGRSKRGKKIEIKWGFTLLKKELSLKSVAIRCIDISNKKIEAAYTNKLINNTGIKMYSMEQLNKTSLVGEKGYRCRELSTIEYLRIKWEGRRNVHSVEGYIFGYVKEDLRRYTEYNLRVANKYIEDYKIDDNSELNIPIIKINRIKHLSKYLRRNKSFSGYIVINLEDGICKFIEEYSKGLDEGNKVGVWGLESSPEELRKTTLIGKNASNTFYEGFLNKRTVVSNIEKYSFEVFINGRTIGESVIPKFKNSLSLSINIMDKKSGIEEISVIAGKQNNIFQREYNGEHSIFINENINMDQLNYIFIYIKCKNNGWIISSPIYVKKI
ncbi:hypothetical protein [Oceanirhabdus sp. W0125-5]|uniref:hypothetical protein n=1 Tax=Oceanirhabdus sp. W0125-5 TaxID=2999116 RepID=UPI0022F2F19C|nr:hypothetical protein [Oceanirhabdus sp. W0125-5]WBW97686.1 hypothetical protein OW730_02590 [Oceanirhabdus sp. W0125-5]